MISISFGEIIVCDDLMGLGWWTSFFWFHTISLLYIARDTSNNYHFLPVIHIKQNSIDVTLFNRRYVSVVF